MNIRLPLLVLVLLTRATRGKVVGAVAMPHGRCLNHSSNYVKLKSVYIIIPLFLAHLIFNPQHPPGSIALDPAHFNAPNAQSALEAWSLHRACVEVGQVVGSLQPDILLLSTPHGLADLTQFSFYLNSKVSNLDQERLSSFVRVKTI